MHRLQSHYNVIRMSLSLLSLGHTNYQTLWIVGMLRKNAGARATHIKADFCVVRLCYTWVFFCFLHVFPNHQPNGIKPIFSIYLHLECITHPTFSHFLPTILLLYLCTSQVDFFHYYASTETKRPSEPNSTHRWFGCLLLNASHSRPKALTPSLYTDKKKQLTMK